MNYFKVGALGLLFFIIAIQFQILYKAIPSPIDPMHYQIFVTADSAFIYCNNKAIGATVWGHDGIDSVIMKDNE